MNKFMVTFHFVSGKAQSVVVYDNKTKKELMDTLFRVKSNNSFFCDIERGTMINLNLVYYVEIADVEKEE